MMPNPDHTIKIAVDASGNFTYTPTHLRAKKNETINFDTDPTGGNFEVMFKDRTPGDRIHINKNTQKNKGPAGNMGHLQCTNDAGVYQYAAAVYDGTNVFIDAGCGDVGVGD
jgi:hypothetical protein